MPADVWSAADAGTRNHRGRQTGADGISGRRGRSPGARRTRFARAGTDSAGRGGRLSGERVDALCAGRVEIRAKARRVHDWLDDESRQYDFTSRSRDYRAGNWTRGDCRVHTDESGDGGEDGPKHAFNNRDDSAWPRLRQLDDQGGEDE